jgi:hypothetical protein
VRKVLPLIIGFALFVSLPSTVLSGTKEITISHGVDKIDEFVVAAKSVSKFTSTAGVEIANVSLKNNTRDGYKVTLNTTYGALHSTTTDNGEVDIAYRFSVSSSGTTPGQSANADDGAGSFQILSIPTIPPTTETVILGASEQLSGDSLINTPTDLEFTLKVALVTSDFVNMAGTYSDTITIEYTDL